LRIWVFCSMAVCLTKCCERKNIMPMVIMKMIAVKASMLKLNFSGSECLIWLASLFFIRLPPFFLSRSDHLIKERGNLLGVIT